MGFGGLFKSQNKLTDLSNSLALQAGRMKQDAANTEAAALRKEADLAYRTTQEEMALKQREVDILAGQQAQQYLSSGVQMIGTPLAVVNETRKLGQMAIDSMGERAANIQDLLRSRADIVERGGLADLLMAQGQGEINRLQTDISQRETRGNFYRSLFGGLATGGLSILKGLF